MSERIASINPASGIVDKEFAPYGSDEIERRLEISAIAKQRAAAEHPSERRHKMLAVADLIEAELPDIAATVTNEMGKTFSQAKGEALKCAAAFRFFADHGESMLAPEQNPYDGKSRTVYSPLGTILAIMPWNFPLWQVARFTAPGLMVGNVILLKHAPNVPQTALFLEDLFKRAGFGEGVFQTLLVSTDQVSKLIDDPRVNAVTLTGSERAGSAVASQAGKALKKSIMELGGSDPFIVMPSCDVASTARTAAEARLQNNGQSCIAAKRFIVHDLAYDNFKDAFVEEMEKATTGDPFAPATILGPLVSDRGRQNLHDQVTEALGRGARALTGAHMPQGAGYYYPATVLEGVTPGMRAYTEELFGPVATLYRAGSVDEIIRLANDTPYGLGASVFTNDENEIARFETEIQAGMVFVNSVVASSPERSFGGIKHSGYGRELGILGLRELCNAKTIYHA
ncbi:MAG: NAD-dependent succinate-semialdehyde dehydrogenase [Acidimicrobiales bacterium]